MMAEFKLESKFTPYGDQPKAIEDIVNNFNNGIKEQILLGATGTGKTFTVCNVIQKLGKKTLILSHNKTLAGQLYNEVKNFFPHNHVEYFISYYDYYQPEAYVVSSDTFIEKDASINEEIDEMRHRATAALLEYDDVIVIASVSCIYGIGNPDDYKNTMLCLRTGETVNRKELLEHLVFLQYERNDYDFTRGSFRLRGDTLDIIPANEHEHGVRVEFFDDEIEQIILFDVLTGKTIDYLDFINVFSASFFVTPKERMEEAMARIRAELEMQVEKFNKEKKPLEAERIMNRTTYDLEMMKEIGSCSGIENYSRHLELRAEGETPSTLIDFFGKDYLLVVDESHVTIPQIGGMFNGDRSRKQTLVDYGFRLPSALDNRPLRFEEWEQKKDKVLYMSATPGDYEKDLNCPIIQQIIRPTGLLDPLIEIRPTLGQVDDIYKEIVQRAKKNERVLITTLTIKMSEDLTDYLKSMDLKVAYLHSKIKPLERLEIIRNLRMGKYDVLVGINLLREGLDIPEVSLVCILDADKQGFLRSTRSLIQTIGRAARNSKGEVIMYADTISPSMKEAIDETRRRRIVQEQYNKEHNIIPTTVSKAIPESVTIHKEAEEKIVKDKDPDKLSKKDKEMLIAELEEEMREYAKDLNFEMAAQIRDAILELKK
ncbi:MAG: excinuclease ABC subunit UvrB [Acholeplasmatales bacterium]|nr:excinuclease ABC subunit UvrB [Acholeplasmatales bacterium]